MSKTRTLVILIFDDVEVQDFPGPFENYCVANRFTESPTFCFYSLLLAVKT
jgi:hypothetical protein